MAHWRVQVGWSRTDVRWSDSRLGPAMLRAAATRQILASVFAAAVAALASAPPVTAGDLVAKDLPASVASAPRELVVIEEGQVTVDAQDSDLADVLSELGARAEFRLRMSGQFGRVTDTFTVMSVEQ